MKSAVRETPWSRAIGGRASRRRLKKRLVLSTLRRPARLGGPDLGDLVGKPEVVQSDRRIATRRQHDVGRFRKNAEQVLKL